MDLLSSILALTIIVLVIVAIFCSWKNFPTLTGIIISSIMGCLPFYLILCYFGFMGEEKENDEEEY